MSHVTFNKRDRRSRFLFAACYMLHVTCYRGFTIIETLVAIAVLLLAITVPLTLAERSLAAGEAARQEVAAFYLAQEAMEFVRNLRDENALQGRGGGSSWLAGLSECLLPEGCGIDPTASAGRQVLRCDAGNGFCTLSRHKGDPPNEELGGLLGYPTNRGGGNTGEWSETGFQRRIFLSEIEDDKEAKITVRLDFPSGALGGRTLTVTSNILNWYSP